MLKQLRLGTLILKSAAHEVGANFVALQLYPLGIFNERAKVAKPHPDYAKNPRPIILLHGVAHNRSAFIALKKRMENLGWTNIHTLNYSTRHGSLTKMVADLADYVDEVLEKTQAPQVDIVAHSLGGIVSRFYMLFGEGRGRVKTLITLGTPHKGTRLSRLLKGFVGGSLSEDLRENSYLIRSLNQTTLPHGSKIVSIYSERDWTVYPRNNSCVEGMPAQSFKNIPIHHVGHLGLLYSQRVFDTVIQSITEKNISE